MKKYLIVMMGLFLMFPMTLTTTLAEDKTDDKSTDITYDAPAKVTLYDYNLTIVYEISYGEVLKEPSHVSRDDYNFLGWYIKGTNDKWDFASAITDDLELEARYEKKKKDDDSKKSSSSTTTTVSSNTYQMVSTDVISTSKEYFIPLGTTLVMGSLCILLTARKKKEHD